MEDLERGELSHQTGGGSDDGRTQEANPAGNIQQPGQKINDLCLAERFGKKVKEIFVIILVVIPFAQIFLDTQNTQNTEDSQNLREPVFIISPKGLQLIVFIGWIIWSAVALFLALDNYGYLKRYKTRIVKTFIWFCVVPIADRADIIRLGKSNAVFPLCLVVATLCPTLYRFWSENTEMENVDNTPSN